MKKFYGTLACFLQLFLGSCIDYVRIGGDPNAGEEIFPPVVDTKHLSPYPSGLIETISVGKNCRGVTFQVPIEDRNRQDRLYYLWFLDHRLAQIRSIIEPGSRSSAIITFHIDQQFLLTHFETKIPDGFFNRPHAIDFFISNQDYTIPESRYPKRENEDYAYWIVSFSNNPC